MSISRVLVLLEEEKQINNLGLVDIDVDDVKGKIKVPFVMVQKSALGGPGRESLLIKGSLDPKDTWQNDIMENSRYFIWSIHNDGTIELYHRHGVPKFIKRKVKSLDQAIEKINTHLSKII